MKLRYTLVLLPFLLANSGPWAGTVTPGFNNEYVPPQIVYMDGGDLRHRSDWGYSQGNGWFKCWVNLEVYSPESVNTGNGPALIYNKEFGSNYDRTCNGVSFPPGLPKAEIEARRDELVRTLSSTPFVDGYRAPRVNNLDRSECQLRVYIYNAAPENSSWGYIYRLDASSGNCKTGKPPVSCTLIPGASMNHGLQPEGTTNSRVTVPINIVCDSSSSVSLSLSSGRPWLSGPNTAIDSTLSLGKEGATAARVYANPTAQINLISVIDGVSGGPGEYTGTAIVTATWD